ncbi:MULTISPECIES: DUF2069 domain-containing protein [unclassified Lysobacter]|uniref:DUF2069 domain-containing protein n=1 Tax=unclassified Lysobacter TaxID=2635362 RepID=UPI001C221615|nr:DUF2069 domain-containing protein [Lysobacter sp. MMG2]MBU8975384.1 DUF2069 domain-containing protein [Lysobacter sp. MMG2]
MNARHVLVIALLALTALFIAWFAADASPVAELLVFALPPLALAAGVLRRMRAASFWAGVLALAWFSHGVMVAWSRPAERGFALTEVVLAIVVVFSASLPGLRARFARKG